MDAPKCKICGDRHFGMCPATIVVNAPREAPPIIRVSRDKPVVVQFPGGSISLNPGESFTFDYRTNKPIVTKPFDRTAYQREYMRKRRAEKKASAGA